MTAWRSAAEELGAYEGIRHGEEDAFRRIAEPLQPVLRRLAGLYVPDGARADAIVLHTWQIALGGTDMFRWQTPYATWIAGIAAACGRRLATTSPVVAVPRPHGEAPAAERVGPPDWRDLPWSPRWELAWVTLDEAVAALPLEEHEVLHGHDVEGWSPRTVCDVFGLTAATYEQRLDSARDRLHDALATLVGAGPPREHHGARIVAIVRCLAQPEPMPEPLDPRALAAFHRWSAGRGRPWRWLLLRRSTGRAA